VTPTSLGLLLLLGLLSIAVLTLTIWEGTRRRSRNLPRGLLSMVGGGVLAITLAVAGTAVGINRHFDLYRSWGDLLGPQSRDLVDASTPSGLARATSVSGAGEPVPQHGTLLRLTIPAGTSRLHVMSAYVYLPAEYRSPTFANTAFPVVEAFNGSPGRPSDWINGIRADTQLDAAMSQHLVAPAIVIFAPTNTGFLRSLECADTHDGLRDETYLTNDVHHWATTHLRTAGPRWTALGYSTGGYCALDLAVRHPDEFARAISLDGYGRALQDHYARGIWRDRTDRLEHSPDWWIMNHQSEPISFYLAAGTHDREAAKDALRTWHALSDSGWRSSLDQLVIERGGRHTFRDWEHALIPSLRWALPGAAGFLQPSNPATAALEAVPPPGRTCAPAQRRASAHRDDGTCHTVTPSSGAPLHSSTAAPTPSRARATPSKAPRHTAEATASPRPRPS
jgi:enterochelin esterase-like enzyme